jgi:hypothetical protein
MENHTYNSSQQWISNKYHTRSAEKTDTQKAKTKTETPNHNNTTKQEMGNIHLSESTNKKGY